MQDLKTLKSIALNFTKEQCVHPDFEGETKVERSIMIAEFCFSNYFDTLTKDEFKIVRNMIAQLANKGEINLGLFEN